MESVYTVPIIPYNLSKNETIIQIAEVLEHLSNVTESLLKSVHNRVENSDKKLNDLSERIDKVNLKVNKLNGAKKATQVFSNSKYPAANVNKQYISLFAEVDPVKLTRNKVKHRHSVVCDEPLEKLHVYHVKVKNPNEKTNLSGLGDMPHDIAFVNDTLLYNSGKNLYKNFVMSDSLDITSKTKVQDASDKSDIEPAPFSISERSNMTKSTTQPYIYSPNLGEVPTLDVPLDLPDLPGIADDLRYEKDESPGIAPSVISTPHIPDLPLIETSDEASKDESPQVELPPPPPQLREKPKEELPVYEPPVQSVKKEEESPVIEQTLPDVQTSNNTVNTDSEKNTPVVGPSVDVHASLMEAIRKAGGAQKARLKAVAQEKETVKKSVGGGDLMADLHAKLSLRRKGISGTKKNENTNVPDGSSTMERISAMIPPPAPKNDTTDSANTEDEEWDD